MTDKPKPKPKADPPLTHRHDERCPIPCPRVATHGPEREREVNR